MTGLVAKDLLCLRKGMMSVLLILVLYCFLAIAGVWDISFLAGFIAVLIAMLPFNCFSYDHAAKWDIYALTLPVSRNRIVAARYITVLVLTAVGIVIALAAGGIAALLGRVDDGQTYLVTCGVVPAFAAVINAVMLPLLYKFGAERARIIFYGVLAAVIAVAFLVFRLLGGTAFLESLDAPSPAFAAALPFAALAAGVVLLVLSYFISCAVYARREL